MEQLADFCRKLKEKKHLKKQDTTQPVGCWTEKDKINQNIVDAFVIIFKTRGCAWAFNSGCSMCGYFNDSIGKNFPYKHLLKQLDRALERYSNEKYVKIFTSGSFLDDKEINTKTRNRILKKIYEKADKISVESRPEFITEEKLSEIKKISENKKFEIGIGLETANDFIRNHCINKGFTFKDYKKAAELLKKHGITLKTYTLIKPPFLTEEEAIKDVINTVEKIKNITDTISFNPVNVQKNTVVEYLWKRNQYRPPWLWSIIEILKESKDLTKDILLKCDIAGGGTARGAHNCENCNQEFLKKIEEFSLSQNKQIFENLDCKCKEKWLDQLNIEKLGFGSLTDI